MIHLLLGVKNGAEDQLQNCRKTFLLEERPFRGNYINHGVFWNRFLTSFF